MTATPGPRQSLQQVLSQMQAQAGRLKSEALKAGYMEALDAWSKGAGREVLEKRLWVAQREKTRYMAERIAQTELARAYTDRVAGQIMADDTIEVVQVRLNPRHPLPDICDLHAKANLWGLGPGIYPKAKAPKPPFHPHCWCKLVTRPDLTLARAKEREDGAREFLRSLPPAEAARILGSRERLDYVLNGADWEAVTQASVRPEYRLKRLGDGYAPKMAPAPVPLGAAASGFWGQRPGLADLPPVPVVQLTGDEFGQGLTHAQLMTKAANLLKEQQVLGNLVNEDTGWKLTINRKGVKKMGDNLSWSNNLGHLDRG